MLDSKLSNEDRKVYVNKCSDGRIRALIVYSNGKKVNVSYPRLLMEENLGRPLLSNEDIHHIDGNPLNNDLSNLEIKLHGEHQREHNQKKRLVFHDKVMTCDYCGKEFIWTAKRQLEGRKYTKRAKNKNKPRHIFCSRSCSGSYGRMKQLGRNTHMPL